MNSFLSSDFFMGLLGAAVVIVATLFVSRLFKKNKPKYVLLTADEAEDNMRRQSAYLTKRIKGIERIEPHEREARVQRIKEQLEHFQKTFRKVDGFKQEWEDLNIYMQQQENIFSVRDLQRR